jgi:phosphate-selective porin OprO/OprP
MTPLSSAAACLLGLVVITPLVSAAEPAQPRSRTVNEPSATVPRQGGDIAVKSEEKSTYDQLWALPVLYKNDDSRLFNEFRLIGRFHGDVFEVDSSLGHAQDWIARRVRLGAKIELFERHLIGVVELDFDPQGPDPAYRRLTDAFLAWTFNETFKLTVGKHGMRFTLDGATSSNELLTIDRSNVANNMWFTGEYAPGISLSGKKDSWVYNVGFYSGGSASPEFGNFDAGNLGLASVGYDFGKSLGVKKALLRADYVYNDPNTESTFVNPLEQIAALVFVFDAGNWGASADIVGARGAASQSDLFGTSVMPWYNITKQLQVVGRYAYVASDENNGVRLNRYDNVITSGRGNEYHEFYAGLNYYLYGHKLKLQTGVTYATMHDEANDGGQYEGWSVVGAVRFSF